MAPRPLPGDEPAREPEDLDSQWADIVARLGDLGGAAGDPPAPAPHPRPPAADGDHPGETPGTRTIRPAGAGPRPRDPAGPPSRPEGDVGAAAEGPAAPRAWAPDPEVEEAEDHFVPPDPGPVLGGDPLLSMAWVLVVAVPVLLVVAIIAWRDVPAWVLQVAGAGFVAAVGLLVWRMPHRRDPDDDDPGAVV